MEYYTKHPSDLIDNRNVLEELYGQNIICFFAALYLETNSMLTARILEGLIYREDDMVSMFNLPFLVYDDTFNYIVAVPTLIAMQVFMLGNPLKIFLPLSMFGLWS